LGDRKDIWPKKPATYPQRLSPGKMEEEIGEGTG